MNIEMAEEWIGLNVRITNSPNPNNIGIEGKIVRETLNTVTLLTEKNERKVVPKKGAKAQIANSKKILDLNAAQVRPEERSKRLYAKLK
ncbi:MAG: ribonuclease P protein subunit [Candidatus Micrarchaeota archaeon]